MTQFLGVAFSAEDVRVASLTRDLRDGPAVTSPIANPRRDASGTCVEIVPAEWVRAAGFALEELYAKLPAAARRLWGMGLAGPTGWIALDLEYAPLTDIRLLEPGSVLSDIARWLDENPRLARRIAAVLSPKDYFRFAISRSLAADATTASALDCLDPRSCDWDRAAAARAGIDERWLPPVFESTARTGRLDAEGMRQTGLPGSLWMVAGAVPRRAAMVAAGDLRAERIWAPDDGGPIVFALGELPYDASTRPAVPEGYVLRRSAVGGHAVLERLALGSGEEDAEAARRELEAAGFHAGDTVTARGSPEAGAAALAAIGSGIVASWDRFYRQVSEASGGA